MKFSAKTRYAARILLVLAACDRSTPVPSRQLAAQTGISQQFIEQILREFRLCGIVNSTRGPKGGHVLACSPDEVSFGCIVKLMEGGMNLSECAVHGGGRCDRHIQCKTRRVWRAAQIVLEEALESITLQDFLEEGASYIGDKCPD